MDNHINEIRSTIRALRVRMRGAEVTMREQIKRDEDCTLVADEIMKMRAAMSGLVRERTQLGDNAPILVNSFFVARQPSAPNAVVRPAKRKLVARQ